MQYKLIVALNPAMSIQCDKCRAFMPHDGFACCCHKRRKCEFKACIVTPVHRCEDREANAPAASDTHRTLTSESGVSAGNAMASGYMDPMPWRRPAAVRETLRRYLAGEMTLPALAEPGHAPGPELSNFIMAMSLQPPASQ